MNTQGTHKPFPTDNMGFESASVRAWSAPAPRRRHPSKHGASGTDGVVTGPGNLLTDCLELLGGMYSYLTSQQKCQLSCWKGPTPADMGPPPHPWTRPFGIAVGAGLVVQSSSWPGKQRKESSSEAWVWWAVLSCLPKKMRWCHHEDVSVLVLNSKR